MLCSDGRQRTWCWFAFYLLLIVLCGGVDGVRVVLAIVACAALPLWPIWLRNGVAGFLLFIIAGVYFWLFVIGARYLYLTRAQPPYMRWSSWHRGTWYLSPRSSYFLVSSGSCNVFVSRVTQLGLLFTAALQDGR